MSNNRLIFLILIIIAIFLTVSSVSASELNSAEELNITSTDEISLDESPNLLRSAGDDSNYVEKGYDDNVLSEDEKSTTQIISQNGSFVYNESGSLSVRLVDGNNTSLYNQTIYAFENDILIKNLTTDENGQAILEIDTNKIPDKDYSIKFIFNETPYYKGSAALAKYEITKMPTEIISANVTAEYNDGTEFTVTLNNKNGKGIKGKDITVKSTLATLTGSTDGNGQHNFTINGLPAGIHNATINFDGDELYEKSFARISIVINKASSGQVVDPKNHTRNISVVYGGAKYFNVTLTDAKGNPLNDTNVTVTLNNQTYILKTDKKGEVNVTIEGLKPQNYTATITFEGNETLERQTLIINLTILKSSSSLIAYGFTSYYPDGGYLNITLKDEFGNNITDAKVNINLNNQTFSNTTDAMGQIKYFANLSAGIYNVTIFYDGDECYINSSTVAYIHIKKEYTLLETSNLTTVYQDGKYLVVTLKDINGNNISNANVTFRLNNETFVRTTNSSGQASLYVDLLPKQYNARIIFEGNDKYYNSYADATITINRLGTVLSASNITTVYGKGKYLIANLTDVNGTPIDNVTVFIRLNNETYNMTTNGSGQVSMFVDLLPKVYYAKITFDGDDRYINSYVNVPVVVNKLATQLNATPIATVYGKGKYLVANLTDADGNPIDNVTVSIRLNNETYNITTDGSGQVSLFVDLLPKQYNAFIAFDGDDRYINSYVNVPVVVNRLDTVLEVTGFTTVYGDGKNVTAILKDENDNPVENVNVSIKLDNETYVRTTDSNGQVILFADLLPKYYTASVVFAGDEMYSSSYDSANVTVNKLATVLDASGFTTVYGDGKNVTAILKDENGNPVDNVSVSIKLDNVTYIKTTDGNGHVSLFVDLLPKYYTASVVFAGDERYSSSYDSANVTVNKLATVLDASGFTTVYDDGKYLIANLTDVNGNAIENVNVSIKLDNVTYIKTTDANGQVSLFVDLSAKQYNALIAFDGDERYINSYINVPIVVNRLGTVLEASGFTTVYGDGKNVTAILKDVNGNPVENAEVSIKLDNVTYVKTTDADGQVKLFADLLPKYYTATVVFAGDNRYGSSYDYANVTVNKLGTVLNATGFTAYYGEGKNLVATLKDVNGNPVENAEVSIKLNDVTYVKTTDADGQVSLLVDLMPKQYRAVIIFDGDKRYSSSYTTANIIINKVPAVVNASNVTSVYSEGEYIVASLKDANGNNIPNTEVQIQVNNETYVRTTDDNGQVSLPVDNLLPKQYTAVITITGNDKYADSYITVPVVVKKLGTEVNATGFTTVYGKAKYVVATLKDENGNLLKNKNISVKFVSKTYVASTDENGQMKLLLNLVPKIYKSVVTFEGDEKYLKSTTTVNITVYKVTTKLTAPKRSFKKSLKIKKYTVTLKTNKNKVIKKAKVTLKVNKKTYTAKTNSKGKATFKITNLKKKGTFNAVVKYMGSKYYKPKLKTTKITVR